MTRWLCKLGWHSWRHVGFNLTMITEEVRCRRCGRPGWRQLG
jgi:hypothetical protein